MCRDVGRDIHTSREKKRERERYVSMYVGRYVCAYGIWGFDMILNKMAIFVYVLIPALPANNQQPFSSSSLTRDPK